MQTTPWVQTDHGVELVPDIYAVMPGSAWPPAEGGLPAGTARAGTWSIQRALQGSLLPGQVRGATGFSRAAGSFDFPQPTTAGLMAPWRTGALDLTVNGACYLTAGKAGVAGATLPLGRFKVDQVEASIDDAALDVTLIEDQPKGIVTIPAILAAQHGFYGPDAQPDAAWVIDQAANAGGYRQYPKPVASAMFAAGLAGCVVPDVGSAQTGYFEMGSWATSPDGRTCLVDSFFRYTMTGTVNVGDSVYVTLTKWAGVDAEVGLSSQFGNDVAVVITDTLLKIGGTSASESTPPSTALPASLQASGRVQVQINRVAAGNTRARVRMTYGGTWSAWITTNAGFPYSDAFVWASVGIGGSVVSSLHDRIAGVQVHTADDPAVWAASNSAIAASGSNLTAVLVDPAQDAWTMLQDVAGKTLGAAWVSEAGVLTYVNRNTMKGFGVTPVETIVARDSFDKLAWSIGTDDVADGVELSYQPPDVVTSTTYTATIWQATDAVAIGAGKTYTLYADLDGAADAAAPWLPIWDTTTAPLAQQSRWAAATSRDGGGTQPASTALRVTTSFVSPSRIKISITNTTTGTLYTVDGTGDPTLTVRANVYATAGESVTISSGASADTAATPLQIDLGSYVQDDGLAQSLLDWITSQTQTPSVTLSAVRVAPNLARQLGDVVIIKDPVTTLSSKAIITAINLSGGPGTYSQSVTLVLLDALEYDLATFLAAHLGTNTEAGLGTYITTNLGASVTEQNAGVWLAGKTVA